MRGSRKDSCSPTSTRSMPDRKASLEGTFGRSRHRSPASDKPPNLLSTLSTAFISTTQSTTPIPRRRSLRPNPVHNELSEPTSQTWVDYNKGESQKTLRKVSGGSSPIPPKPSFAELEQAETEKNTVGFLPKLGRIPEGKESKNPRRRRGSTTSSAEDYTPPRRHRRPVENATLGRRPIRQKHGSLQRRAETLASLPNPSLISVLSGTTQLSSASSGSNSTITQQSYNKTHIIKRRPVKERKRLQAKSTNPKAKVMDSQQATVFQYMHEDPVSDQWLQGDPHGERPSSSASSSSAVSSEGTEHDDGQSSNAEEPSDESPMTSPASTRRPDYEQAHYRHRSHSDSGISVRESSPESLLPASRNYHIEEEDKDEDDDDDDDDEEEEDDEEDSSESDNEDGDDNACPANGHSNLSHPQHLAMERVPPPRVPSTSSSRHSDPHTRRMRAQEQELRDHVLQSPQPHKDFQFVGGPSPNPHHAMPLYDPYAHNGTSPVDYYPTPHPAGWPPQAPPPPTIGYYSPPHIPPVPYAPTFENSSRTAPQYSMASPNTAVLPPLHHVLQPPHYQPQPIEPNLSKTTVMGYELLADKLTELSKNDNDAPGENTVVPLYRKFEQLNHRILLHLQDEISELEEELRQLDECIAQSSARGEAGRVYPASRRGEARYGGELHYKRTTLLGQIYLKLGQYNQALSSYSNMVKNLNAPTTQDIQAYHSWMEKHAPIDRTEARFLEHKTDLVAMSQRRIAQAVGGAGPHHSAAIGFPLILVLPLMAFAVVPGLLGRLFIVILIGAGELVLVSSTELLDLMSIKEWVACSSIYFGLLCLLAAVAH